MRDDIDLVRFQLYGPAVGAVPSGDGVIKYSPNGRYFAVVTEKDLLDLNVPEETIWLFRTEEVQKYVHHPDMGTAPLPIPLVRMSTDKMGLIIRTVKWLADSTGIAFTTVKKSVRCQFNQLYLADIRTGHVQALTEDDQNVDDFDFRNRDSYVYSVSAPKLLKAPEEDFVPLTGRIDKFLFPEHPLFMRDLAPFDDAGLWEVMDGHRSRIMDAKAYGSGSGLSLSPDGTLAVAIMNAEHPPADWVRYKAAPGNEDYVDPKNANAYHLIDLRKGTKKLLFNAPCGTARVRWVRDLGEMARWSADGRSLALSSTFFPLDTSDSQEAAKRERQAYMAVLRLDTGELTAIQPLRNGLDKGQLIEGRYAITDLHFADDHTVVVNYDRFIYQPDSPPMGIFHQGTDGTWKEIPGAADPISPIRVEAREEINQPPVIVAADKAGGAFHVIWDPNPQLKEIELGETEVIHGTDANGFKWEAGLVKPPNYQSNKQYPLVIQTHGFTKKQFMAHGSYTSAYAARALAAVGIIVVQAGGGGSLHDGTPQEGPDQVAVYQSIVNTLTAAKLIDPKRVGATGFSRTGYHILYAMAASPSLLAAASVSDFSTFGYFEYLLVVNHDPGMIGRINRINGGTPFTEEGMKNWRTTSPEFNMDKTKAPLLLVQPGAMIALFELGPYTAMRYLHKPVDLIMIPTDTHPLTNPRGRFNCETFNVDWFRFWLQDYEDPDPAKAEQYARWRELRKMQEENDAKAKAAAVN